MKRTLRTLSIVTGTAAVAMLGSVPGGSIAQEKSDRAVPGAIEKAIPHRVEPRVERPPARLIGCPETDDPHPDLKSVVRQVPLEMPAAMMCRIELAVANLGDSGVEETHLAADSDAARDPLVHVRMDYTLYLSDGSEDHDNVWITEYPDALNLSERCSRTGWYEADYPHLVMRRGLCGDLVYRVDMNNVVDEGSGERYNETTVTLCCD